MLRLEDHWVWDSWYATDDDGRYHVFFLRASRALLDPDRRHRRAVIGHAISHDLRAWELTADALVPSDRPGWDDVATWTGSTLGGPDGRWYMYYTGVGSAEDGLVQRIGLAVSDDLTTWHRHGDQPLVEADPTWYERLGEGDWYEEAWRDPWVFADPGGDGWHMLITARANHGPAHSRGVIGHARSADLLSWTVQPPLTAPATFGHLEVPQVTIIDGHPFLLFCTNSLAPTHGQGPSHIWTIPGESLTGPWDITAARPFPDPHLYAPRLVTDTDGTTALIGFIDQVDGTFIGELTDPIPVTYTPDSGLTRSHATAEAVS
ncbi:glycoside hydrolase family 68 protein [Actinomadura sp. HBU206391]|uniref:glycoside hydrolase family 68 protein n=1 Tax=Actinomadura sp. HBU206391 TaxID=2731692 RepID=UPI00165026A5|nr:glycoside hydrolase family 68 protein [Actinomadura sp. HBU206391]MBC6461408.1 glycoside hydrolase family 68 protein [Actinomadura sp. HBU206391]